MGVSLIRKLQSNEDKDDNRIGDTGTRQSFDMCLLPLSHLEQDVSTRELCQDAPEAPYIDLVVVGQTQDDLGGSV